MASDPGHTGWARNAFAATLAYAALTIALTWPLARGLTHDVPSDLGDPLLNSWILAWDADHLLRALSGHPAALAAYWHANIYAPHPYTLAYSEHLTAQAIEILPVYALTRNPLLCYNLVFLATFPISGLAMFLFARALTASRAAAFVAGLAYAFAPYRFGSISHVQVLSSMWMPLVLHGFRCFFGTGRVAPLAGAAAAWTVQNLSCSYYLVFFSPVIALYLAWELTTRGAWRDLRTIGRLSAAIAVVVLATAPFVLPYIELRRLGFMPRSLGETDRFGADVYGYLTAPEILRLWGSLLRVWPKGEGWMFPGLTITTIAVTAVVAAWRDARLKPRATTARVITARAITPHVPTSNVARGFSRAIGTPAVARGFSRAVAIAFFVASITAIALLFGWSLRLPFLKITSFDRAFVVAIALSSVLLAWSRRARTTARTWTSTPVGMLTLLTLFAVAMSFGPHIHSRGKLVEDTNVYMLFYDYVPGFDGLRVPARFGMVVALGLGALTAFGIAEIQRRRGSRAWTALAAVLIVVESIAVPLPLNGNDTNYKQHDLAPLPPFVETGEAVPAVYHYVAHLPPSATLLELPFGEAAFEVRYVFYSTTHWRPLVNGYSGGVPVEYGPLAEALKDLLRDPERAWIVLLSSAATHVVVHEASYLDGRGIAVSDWLRRHAAREVAAFGTDRVFAVPRPPA